jgi:hypothetical protein
MNDVEAITSIELGVLDQFDSRVGWRWDVKVSDEEQMTGYVLNSTLYLCQYHLLTLDGDQADPVVKAEIMSNKQNVIVSGIATSYCSVIRHMTFAFLQDIDQMNNVGQTDGGVSSEGPLLLATVRADMSKLTEFQSHDTS